MHAARAESRRELRGLGVDRLPLSLTKGTRRQGRQRPPRPRSSRPLRRRRSF
uniref:Uncharacterized protein n=1 Tax=Zea mays TaxID=4577 RepID=C0HHF4_MAIZE|nr:unknown [Zea mays]